MHFIDDLTDGCVHGNASHPVGVFHVGCEASCTCSRDGDVTCQDRCQPPYHLRGRGRGRDPLCLEQPVENEECCIILTCAGNASTGGDDGNPCKGIHCGPNAECRHEVFRGEGSAETICVCKDGYTGDPDSKVGCSEHPKELSSSSTSRGFDDSNHPADASRRPISEPPGVVSNLDPSNPLSKGLLTVSKGSTRDGTCRNKNGTYAAGEEWFDGCEFRCVCSQKREILCQPRCKLLPGNPGGCELAEDPKDSCCKVLACPAGLETGQVKSGRKALVEGVGDVEGSVVGLAFDGCMFKNKTHMKASSCKMFFLVNRFFLVRENI